MTETANGSTAAQGRIRRRIEKATKADISRERVLAAAAKIFSERGYAGTTMRAVAQEVGLQAGSLYYHYRSKEELIEAVLDLGINGVSETVRGAIAALPPKVSGRRIVEAAVLAHLKGVVDYGVYALSARRTWAGTWPSTCGANTSACATPMANSGSSYCSRRASLAICAVTSISGCRVRSFSGR